MKRDLLSKTMLISRFTGRRPIFPVNSLTPRQVAEICHFSESSLHITEQARPARGVPALFGFSFVTIVHFS